MDFLELDEVLLAHDRCLKAHGGMPGVRDPGLVDSALASARNVYYYGGGNEFAVAAAYAFHLAESQAFFDGNKRVAVTAALMFLARNGWAIPPSAANDIYEIMIGIAKHEKSKADLASLFGGVAIPVP